MIYNQDILKYKSKELYHAVLCDPPYHLTSPVVSWETYKRDNVKGNASGGITKRGFMGKEWDGGDIAFNPKTWEHIKSLLLPGAFGMAFASSRGWHRMAVAIEDAGFVIHPTIFCWVFGSGFPKATDVSKMIMKQVGDEGEEIIEETKKDANLFEEEKTVKQKKIQTNIANKSNDNTGRYNWNTENQQRKESIDIKNPTDPKAKVWNGWKYGLQALKPAVEPIIVFQKPYKGKPIECMVENGCGALNIDGSRIISSKNAHKRGKVVATDFGDRSKNDGITPEHQGRFPSNFILTEQTAPLLDKQSGESKSNQSNYNWENSKQGNVPITKNIKSGIHFNDKGGASRFFYNVKTKIDEADPIKYQAKASKSERNAGCEELEEKEKKYKGFGLPDLRMDKLQNRIPSKNNHPTVKPLDLCKYLATLLLPPKEYNPRLLVPFSGSGSEYIGAMKAGWENIDGVEMDSEYCKIAEARIKYWKQKIKDENAQQALPKYL